VSRKILILASYIFALVVINIGITATMHYSGSPRTVLVSLISFLFLENLIRAKGTP